MHPQNSLLQARSSPDRPGPYVNAYAREIRVFISKAVVKSDTNAEGESFVGLHALACRVRLPGDQHTSALGSAHYNESCVTKVKFVTYDTCFFRTPI